MARTWPLMVALLDLTLGPPGLPSGNSVSLLDNPSTGVVLRGWSTQRGRQYELGTVSAGTLSMDLTDPKEYLNPVNTSSPWNSGANTLLPYRACQVGAWWNPSTKDATGNMLNATNFPPGTFTIHYDPSFESSTGGWFAIAGSPTMATSTAQHFAGAQALSVTYNASGDVAAVAIFQPPNRQHTLSLYVFVPASHTVTATWANVTYGGATLATATSSTTGAWQRLTMTATPSSWTSVISVTCTSAYPATVYIDAVQLELGGSASTFTTSGPTWFPVYTGYIERYPQHWDMAGFRGLRPLEAVDGLSPLSRTVISQSYASTILADGPSVYVPYNDESFPTTAQRPTGGQPIIPYQSIGSQSASVTFGGDTFLDGSRAVTLSQHNSDPLTAFDNTQTTRLGTNYGAVLMDPTSFTFEIWVRWTAGQTWFGAGSMAFGESSTDPTLHDGPVATFGFRSNNNNQAVFYKDTAGNVQFSTGPVLGMLIFPDGAWHHLVLSGTGTNSWRAVRDGVVRTGTYDHPTPPIMAINNIYAYVNTVYGDIISTASFANAAIYNSVLSTTQISNHYQRGIGYVGEKSGTRANRLLTKYWSSNIVTDTGKTGMAPDFSYNGRAMLDVLQEIADTEAGLVWADAFGLIHQDSRETRYTVSTSTTSQYTFGENTAGGELPYEDLEYDYDPTYVYSQANFTAAGSGNQLAPVVNSTSQTAYGQRILSKTLQMQYDWDVNQAAQFYVQRYAKPAGAPGTNVPPRISKLTINPASNPNLWAPALDLDIGNRVTVKRRTSAGVTVSGDYYIEKADHHVNAEQSTWTVDYQLSPVFVSQAWILGDSVKSVLGTSTVCVY